VFVQHIERNQFNT